jgi:16S rRNA (guanine966-N2)-methyltransferase
MSVRIVAGRFRGRRLECPKQGTRPTLERVREALFSILGDLEGLSVVDLYAGSGALGFEALSRGARQVALVEADRNAAALIRKNAAAIGAENSCRVIENNVEDCRGALKANAPLDLVLADPPWRISQQAMSVIPRVVRDLVSEDARIVIGHPARESLEPKPESGLVLDERRTWGDSGLSFFQLARK